MIDFKKSLLFVSMLLILCVSLGAVSAADIDVNDIGMDDANQGNVVASAIAVDGTENGDGGDSAISNLKADENTFSALNATINSGKTEITLDKDYVFTQGNDDAFKNGIVIDKSMTIDGKGHTIDGSNLARMFFITADAANVKILNLNFKNGYVLGNDADTGSGGAIFSRGSGLIIDNCNFTNNKAPGNSASGTDGFCGAVYINGANSQILNSKFEGNMARCAGAVRFAYAGIVDNCSFINNVAITPETVSSSSIYGGALYISASNVKVLNSKFEGNNATVYGGAIAIYAKGKNNFVIDNCTFSNNNINGAGSSAKGGAIFINQASDILINNSKFISNAATFSGGAIYANGDNNKNVNITSCFFVSNSAGSGNNIEVNDFNAFNINYCIFEDNLNEKGVICVKSGDVNFDYNFWGISSTDQFNLNSLIKTSGGWTPVAPKNIVVVKIDDENIFDSTTKKVSFVCNDSSELTGVLPDYNVSLSNSLGNTISPTVVTISNNEGEFNYTVAVNGVETIEAKRVSDNKVLDTANFKVVKGTFTHLQALIDEADGELILPMDFCYDSEVDSALKNGVVINKSITINGNGHTIDGKNLARIFNITADNVIIKNITLINGKVTNDNGGAIYWSGANGKITDSTLNHNFASGSTTQGGAIFSAGSNLEVDKCIFNDNAAGTSWKDNYEIYGGGSIYIATDGCTVSNSKFSNAGIAGQYIRNGAGILVNGTNAKVTGCTFEDLTSSLFAGAICTNGNSSGFELKDSTFKNIKASNGGAVAIRANANINNCSFDNCVGDFAAGILVGTGSAGLPIDDINIEINDCSFTNCHSNYSSASLANGIIGLQDEVKNAVISGNTLFENCSSKDNSGWGTGSGAIYNKAQNLIIDGTLIVNNCSSERTAGDKQSKGGAIVNREMGTVEIRGDLIINNSEASIAAGIYNQGNLAITGSTTISNNNATDGGAIYNTGNLTVEGNVTLENNTATNNGGAIYNTGNLNVDGAKFIGNNASDAGSAIYSTGNLTISNVEIIPAEGDDKPPISSTEPVMNITMNKTIAEGDILTVTVSVSKDNVPATGEITLIDDYGPNHKALVDGVASFNVSDLLAGEHILTIVYRSEDGTYNTSVSEKVIVKEYSNISVTVDDIKVGQDAIIKATVPKDATGDVTLIIGDKTQVLPIENGVATFNVSGLTAGLYNIKVVYAGDNKYLDSQATGTFNVKPATIATKITASNMKFSAYTSKNLVITLKDANGKVLAGKKVTIKLNGKTYTRTTDSKGQAKLAITSKYVKTYTATIKFAGDSKYLASSKSVKVTITTAYVTVKDIIKGAKYLKSYSIKYKKLPATIKVGACKVSHAQLSYLMANAIKKINAGKKVSTKVKVINVKYTAYNTKVSRKVYKFRYMNIVNSLYNQGVKGKLPKYVKYNTAKIGYNAYTYSLAKILAFYDNKNRLPYYCVFKRY